jgi:di/tricarboxylate transporter
MLRPGRRLASVRASSAIAEAAFCPAAEACVFASLLDPSWHSWITLAVLIAVFITLARNWGPPDMVMLGAAVLLTLLGIVPVGDLLAGFADPAVITIGGLVMISAGLRETGAIDALGRLIFARTSTERGMLVRLGTQVSLLSAFLNNTAVVAMLVPPVVDWCRRNRVSPSRVLIPLSFFTVLGGTVTVIGTSTNVLVTGLMQKAEIRPFALFDLAWVGVPVTVVGGLFMLTIGRRLLPDRKDLLEDFSERSREYLIDMCIEPGCRLIGQTVQNAGLRNLPGLFLIEVLRDGQVIAPVEPDEILREGDRLTFTGVVSTIVELERIPGFVPAGVDPGESGRAARRRYFEAVLSGTSPVIGESIRDSNFRARYNAAVLAVHRGGTRLRGRVGDIVLQPGDTLLLQTGAHFDAAHRNDPDFYLVSGLEDQRPVRHSRAALAGGFLVALVALLFFERYIPVVLSVVVIAGLMILTRCISATDARRAAPLDLLLAIVGALALGRATDTSGMAAMIADGVVHATAGFGPIAALGAMYLVALLLTEIVTNNAAAALGFPLAMEVATRFGVSPVPFILALTYAASLGFATPFGYQTHLMVLGPGGYRFADFVRIGVPLDLLCGIVAVTAIALIWGFPPATA